MKKTAKAIKVLAFSADSEGHIQRIHVKMEPSHNGHDYAVLSMIKNPRADIEETMIFPADAKGKIQSWVPIAFERGTINPSIPLANISYALDLTQINK